MEIFFAATFSIKNFIKKLAIEHFYEKCITEKNFIQNMLV